MPIISLIKAIKGDGGDDTEKFQTPEGFDVMNKEEDFGMDLSRKPNFSLDPLSLASRNAKKPSMGGFRY